MSSSSSSGRAQGRSARLGGPAPGETSGQSARVGEPAPSEATAQYVPRPTAAYDDATAVRYAEEAPRRAAYGMTMFAAVMMLVSGAFSFLEGLAAILRGGFFGTLPRYAYDVSVSGWGWAHLILGAVVFVAGVCLFTDMMWARIAGVALATASALLNFIYIPYFPVWSIVLIAVDVAVIWALLSPRHGRAGLREARVR